MTDARAPKVRQITLPPARERMSPARRLYRGFRGAVGTLPFALMAHASGLPGFEVRSRIAAFASRLALGRARVGSTRLYDMLCFPMDSTRYFEFPFVWRRLQDVRFDRYLDISSPRLLPLLVIGARPQVRATLLNPDAADLNQTRQLAAAAGYGARCTFIDRVADEGAIDEAAFDVVTSISVLEHIRDDVGALAQLWRAVRPGGRLLLTVPCAAVGEAQFVNVRHYAFAPVEQDGTSFHQYLYDEPMLERLYAVTGPPAHREVVGERSAGTHLAMYERKWIDGDYPFWREPWFMRRQFQRYPAIAELPGEGVAMLEFVK